VANSVGLANIEVMSNLITPEIVQLVQGIYAGGAYASEADVLSAALQLLQQRDRLRSELKRGSDDLDRGERLDAEEVFDDLRRRAVELDRRGK
jgi:Arc/MetJ-type ribon-helix-helix transcriptional regulator